MMMRFNNDILPCIISYVGQSSICITLTYTYANDSITYIHDQRNMTINQLAY